MGKRVVSRPRWWLPERSVTPQGAFLRRRQLVRTLGLAAGALVLPSCERPAPPASLPRYDVHRNPAFEVSRAITPSSIAGQHNNFYEFTTDKERVHELARDFVTRPWTVEVTGRVHRPTTFDVDELERTMPLEERVLRFRCVEAWAMVVPWTGFPLRSLLERVEPMSDARYVRFVSVDDETLPGIASMDWYPWPYFEALRLDEAMNDLAFVATGIYGAHLPPQHGAPIRLVTPWKYGFKSIKSIVRIELLPQKPNTFWHRLEPREYGFYGNVDPDTPHPRWSQEHERMIDTGARVSTRVFNGYAEHVAALYPNGPSRPA